MIIATVMYGIMIIWDCNVWCKDMTAALQSKMVNVNWVKSTGYITHPPVNKW